ncbi:hypothetical protein M407DRAFT_34605 [Tulasnella calospora MUT 4182]|uniref:Secreted protein n=1 Tax=Tulasnella calospora MUT 4182 TaxID=1051891 RepID=A0A0C3Q0D1_9AGAM|nr:hypothetical protein M407DRAFT_34605 [Tulasnella calospora MUT 4182]
MAASRKMLRLLLPALRCAYVCPNKGDMAEQESYSASAYSPSARIPGDNSPPDTCRATGLLVFNPSPAALISKFNPTTLIYTSGNSIKWLNW